MTIPKQHMDIISVLRAESSNQKKWNLSHLVCIIDLLWQQKCIYQHIHSAGELESIKRSLLNSTFAFCPMFRSFIPKPNKPGKLRPITQPAKNDRIVMEALSILFNIIYEHIFLTNSHGFRKGRGPITFYLQVRSWGKMDRFVKADIVGCFDNIDHGLLIQMIQSTLGMDNANLCNLLDSFLKCQILDKDGKDYSSQTKGIPQGSPLSPVLMNIHLHELDVKMDLFMNEQKGLYYVRYADDMLFGIKGPASEKISLRFESFFNDALADLKLEATSESFIRGRGKSGRSSGTLVLGLLVSINRGGKLEFRAPLYRWKKKLTFENIMATIGENQNVSVFKTALFSKIKMYLSLSIFCSKNQSDLLAFFANLVKARMRQSVKLYSSRCEKHTYYTRKTFRDRLSNYRTKMLTKAMKSLERKGE